MTLLDARARLWLVLEHDDLVAARLAQDAGADASAVHHGLADGRLGTVGDEQDPIDVDGLARLDIHAIDLDLAAELDPILLAAGFDDCVHDPLEMESGESASGGTANRRGGRGQGWYP